MSSRSAVVVFGKIRFAKAKAKAWHADAMRFGARVGKKPELFEANMTADAVELRGFWEGAAGREEKLVDLLGAAAQSGATGAVTLARLSEEVEATSMKLAKGDVVVKDEGRRMAVAICKSAEVMDILARVSKKPKAAAAPAAKGSLLSELKNALAACGHVMPTPSGFGALAAHADVGEALLLLDSLDRDAAAPLATRAFVELGEDAGAAVRDLLARSTRIEDVDLLIEKMSTTLGHSVHPERGPRLLSHFEPLVDKVVAAQRSRRRLPQPLVAKLGYFGSQLAGFIYPERAYAPALPQFERLVALGTRLDELCGATWSTTAREWMQRAARAARGKGRTKKQAARAVR